MERRKWENVGINYLPCIFERLGATGKAMERTRRWEDLGTDCLLKIFEKLGAEDLVLRVSLVCKSWHQATANPHCWRTLDFRNWNSDANNKLLQERGLNGMPYSLTKFVKLALRRSGRSVRALLFPGIYVPFEFLLSVSDEYPDLKCVCLPGIEPEYEKELPKLIRKWKDLEDLVMQEIPSSFMQIFGEISRSCKNFSGLEICSKIHTQHVLSIVKSLPYLKFLNLSWSSLKKADLLVILSGCRDLEAVYVMNCWCLEVDDEVLRRAVHLKSFRCIRAEQHDYEFDEVELRKLKETFCWDLDGGYGSRQLSHSSFAIPLAN